MKRFALALVVMLLPLSLMAQQVYTVTVEDDYEDMLFAVESAILDTGLNIDTVSHVSEMLDRTAESVGATEQLYLGATVFNFCSATLSRDAMSADRNNLRFCPYGIFVYEDAANPGKIVIGHEIFDGESMAAVNAALTAMVDEATR